MSGESNPQRFPSPFDVETPPGCEGWEEMYPYYYLFSEERRELEETKLWFHDGMHHPEPLYPFDTITSESWWVGLGQYNSRVFVVPPALGIDQRVLNGYLYISANAIDDPAVVAERVGHFMERAGYYYEHWNELYERWEAKATATIKELQAIEVPDLPEMEDLAVVTEGRGVTSAYELIVAYDRCIENMYKMWQYHFEFLNLGYAAYLTFYSYCKQVFPDISDQSVAKMVSGIDVMLFRPDAELKRLAALAIELGVSDAFGADRSAEEVLADLETSDAGKQWSADLERTRDPWFYFSNGGGFYHHHRSWIDNPALPFSAIRSYIARLRQGEDIARPLEAVQAERERMTAEYRALLQTDEDRKAFDDQLGLARTVFPYVENHNFYVEHWHHTVFWNKMRIFGALLKDKGFLEDVEDLFYLHRREVYDALYDCITSWAVGTPARGPKYWAPIIAKRKRIIDAMYKWQPPPALGPPPETISEPFTVMLWGITTERVQEWLGAGEQGDGAGEMTNQLTGFAASPGVAEGRARVIMGAAQIGTVEEGEVLVCPITAPSWVPVFSRIAAAVSDIGGVMCHAAIVSREYGLPAVVGTGFATKRIKTGQLVRVDGDTGVVTILDEGE
ncbi:MAG: PEP-utilizing enzyme [Acidimicrobiales bacterium]